MGQATTYCSKGILINKIDENLGQPVQAFVDELVSPTPMFDLGLQKNIVDNDDRPHCEDEFLAGAESGQAYWPGIGNKREIIRAAYIKAISLSITDEHGNPRAKSKPVVTYWVRGLPEGVFEVSISETDLEVHVIWLTEGAGMVEQVSAELTPEKQRMWLMGATTKIDQLFGRYPEAWQPEAPEPMAAVPGVSCLKLPSY